MYIHIYIYTYEYVTHSIQTILPHTATHSQHLELLHKKTSANCFYTATCCHTLNRCTKQRTQNVFSLQHTAIHCNTLHCTRSQAQNVSSLQCVAHAATYRFAPQEDENASTATHCIAATHCNTLHRCNTLQHRIVAHEDTRGICARCSTTQHTKLLQLTATHRIVAHEDKRRMCAQCNTPQQSGLLQLTATHQILDEDSEGRVPCGIRDSSIYMEFVTRSYM